MRTVSDSRAGRRILFAGVRGREFRHGAGESGGRVGEQPAGLVHGVGGLVFASVGVRDPCLGFRVEARGLRLGCFEDPVGFGVGVGQEFLRLFAAFADSPVGFLVDPLFAPRGLFDLFVRFFFASAVRVSALACALPRMVLASVSALSRMALRSALAPLTMFCMSTPMCS